MKNRLSVFYQSSSFKMAILFSILLSFALINLIVLIVNSSDEKLTNSWLLWLSLFMMVAVTAISFYIAFYVVKRINSIASTAQKIIETGKLDSRIPMNFEWDDLSQLADVLNQLLAEIEALVKNVSQVSNNIAHDLRTPLTRLRNEIQSIDNEDHKERLTDEVDKLLGMFNGLLRIANIEAKNRYQAFEQVDLNLLIEDAIELYEPLASDKNIAIAIDGVSIPIFYHADRDLLFQAIANLIDNAIKYTPDSTENDTDAIINSVDNNLRIKLIETKHSIEIQVADNGHGINPNEYDMITRRFYRTDETRAKYGYGLGLALVKAVVKLHGGQLVFGENKPQGLMARLIFPKNNAFKH